MDLRERAAGCLLCGAFFGERAVPRRFTERPEPADLLKESAVAPLITLAGVGILIGIRQLIDRFVG